MKERSIPALAGRSCTKRRAGCRPRATATPGACEPATSSPILDRMTATAITRITIGILALGLGAYPEAESRAEVELRGEDHADAGGLRQSADGLSDGFTLHYIDGTFWKISYQKGLKNRASKESFEREADAWCVEEEPITIGALFVSWSNCKNGKCNSGKFFCHVNE